MKTFAVLVPVLGRPDAVKKTIDAFLASGSERDASLLFIASDTDGPEIDALEKADARYVPTSKRSWACKINVGLLASVEPWLLCAADDVTLLPRWTTRVRTLLEDGCVFGSYDGFNPRTASGDLATHPLVSRSYAEKHGTIEKKNVIAHEGYHHNYVDEEITLTARARGLLRFSPEPLLLHNHWGLDPGRMDETYALGHRFLDTDKALFEARKPRLLGAP